MNYDINLRTNNARLKRNLTSRINFGLNTHRVSIIIWLEIFNELHNFTYE